MPAACFPCVCVREGERLCVSVPVCVYYRTQGLSVLQKINVSTKNNSNIRAKKP